jgi:hypothetical protein
VEVVGSNVHAKSVFQISITEDAIKTAKFIGGNASRGLADNLLLLNDNNNKNNRKHQIGHVAACCCHVSLLLLLPLPLLLLLLPPPPLNCCRYQRAPPRRILNCLCIVRDRLHVPTFIAARRDASGAAAAA